MKNNKPFIYQFKTPKNLYVYDVNRNSILNVNKYTYDFLLNNKPLTVNDEQIKCDKLREVKYLLENNFLSSVRAEKIEHPYTRVAESILNNKLSSITLQITQQCNLRCKYCAYSGTYLNRTHTDKIMSLDIAKKSIDFLMNHSMNSEAVNIGFYGGEPLLNFDLIKESIIYSKDKFKGKEVSFNITTNATLLTKEIISFLEQNNVNLTLSLDGPKQIHNKNRQFANSGEGTFDVIIEKVKFIKKNFPKYFKKIQFNAVIDPSIDFNCTNDFFTNDDILKDSLVGTNFVSTDNLDLSDDKNNEFLNIKYIHKYNYEIFKMFLSKLKRLDPKYISKVAEADFEGLKRLMHSNRKQTLQIPKVFHHSGPCIPGAKRLFISIYGDFYPCEKCNENSDVMKIGNIENGFNMDKVQTLLNIGKVTEDECKDCWAFRLCSLCGVAIDQNGELSKKFKLEKCKEVKLQIHSMMLEYCMLKEFNYDFDINENINLFVED